LLYNSAMAYSNQKSQLQTNKINKDTRIHFNMFKTTQTEND